MWTPWASWTDRLPVLSFWHLTNRWQQHISERQVQEKKTRSSSRKNRRVFFCDTWCQEWQKRWFKTTTNQNNSVSQAVIHAKSNDQVQQMKQNPTKICKTKIYLPAVIAKCYSLIVNCQLKRRKTYRQKPNRSFSVVVLKMQELSVLLLLLFTLIHSHCVVFPCNLHHI